MSLISQTMTATKKHKASLLNFLCLFLAFSCLFVVQAAAQEKSVIIVNERALVGPNSAAQLRGGRLFLPVATIAQALGDTLSSDPQQRIVTIRRQNGTTAVFNAPLNEVRENGAVVLTVSGTVDLVFPPTANELMLPGEIVAALLDVIVRRDESQAIVISRKGLQAETIRTGGKHAPWQIFLIEYDYNLSRYTTSSDHSLVLRGTGRVGDARLSFLTNSTMATPYNWSRTRLLGGTVRLDKVLLAVNSVRARIWNSCLPPYGAGWSNCPSIVCDSISLAGKQLPESRKRFLPIRSR